MGPAGMAAALLCALGGAAAAAAQEKPRATAAEKDEVRELAFRSRLPADRPRNGSGDSPVYCLAFGTDANRAREDPPPAFMKRFRDLEDVHPRSWCVEQRTGNRLSVGPIRIDVIRPYGPVRAALWMVQQSFRGDASSEMVEVLRQTWGWEVSSSPVYEGLGKAPPVPEADLTEDRRRLAALAASYADAWNRRDLKAMYALDTRRPTAVAVFDDDEARRSRLEPLLDTRLDAATESIGFDNNIRPWARVRLKLRGTWTPASGTLVPLDPWKHDGSVTTVELLCYKTTAWWEPGEWSLEDAIAPWDDTRMIE